MSLPFVPLGSPRPKRADAVRNREHLLAVAREVLAERGTAGITMDGLAERAGLGKGTVFRVSVMTATLPSSFPMASPFVLSGTSVPICTHALYRVDH